MTVHSVALSIVDKISAETVCIAAMNESYACGNVLKTMAIFRLSLIFSSTDFSLITMLSTLFRNSITDSSLFLSSRNSC